MVLCRSLVRGRGKSQVGSTVCGNREEEVAAGVGGGGWWWWAVGGRSEADEGKIL